MPSGQSDDNVLVLTIKNGKSTTRNFKTGLVRKIEEKMIPNWAAFCRFLLKSKRIILNNDGCLEPNGRGLCTKKFAVGSWSNLP
jgi:hypothetical protein